MKKIRLALERLLTDFKISGIRKAIIKSNYDIVDVDFSTMSFLVDLNDDVTAVISKEGDAVRLESSLVFDAEILNMKTYGDIANIAFTGEMPITGIIPAGNGNVKIYISRIALRHQLKSMKPILDDFKSGMMCIKKYIDLRENVTKYPMLDLSMFEEMDLNGFDPRAIGEKKEFVFGTWHNFVRSLMRSCESESLDYEVAKQMLAEIKACEEFERSNKLSLAEVGDLVWKELVWNRELEETQLISGSTYIN